MNLLIHGHINIDDIAIKIIDTPEFQRLRSLKQLGVCSYVFPSANHTRFEHSLGVAHISEKMIRNIKNNQPELNISDRDILIVKIDWDRLACNGKMAICWRNMVPQKAM